MNVRLNRLVFGSLSTSKKGRILADYSKEIFGPNYGPGDNMVSWT
jgi:hypothetical protein